MKCLSLFSRKKKREIWSICCLLISAREWYRLKSSGWTLIQINWNLSKLDNNRGMLLDQTGCIIGYLTFECLTLRGS